MKLDDPGSRDQHTRVKNAPPPPINDNNIDESFARTLLEDVVAAIGRHDADQTQQHRRELVRSVFAAIDGYAWLYRMHVVEAAKQLDKLETQENVVLSEVGYAVSVTGKVSKQSRFLSFFAAFRLVTHIATRIWPKFVVRFDGIEWRLAREAFAVRNRITHPKKSSDLALSVGDASTCISALFWLLEVCTSGMEASNRALQDYNSRLRDVFEQLRDGNPEMTRLYHQLKDGEGAD